MTSSPIPSNVVNKKLYASIKNEIHQDLAKKGTRWGIYASSLLVKTYKARGGKYTDDAEYRAKKEGKKPPQGLDRWYKELWINICESDPPKKIVKCGRAQLKQDSKQDYPVCRPYKRVTKETPTTYGEIDKKEIQKICRTKRADPLQVLPKFDRRGGKRA